MHHSTILAKFVNLVYWIFSWCVNLSSIERFRLEVKTVHSGPLNQPVFICTTSLRSQMCLGGRVWRNGRGGVFVFPLSDSCVVTNRPGWERGDEPTMKAHADKTACASEDSWLHQPVPKHTWSDVLTKDKGWNVYSKYHLLSGLTFRTGFYCVFSIRNSPPTIWLRQ